MDSSQVTKEWYINDVITKSNGLWCMAFDHVSCKCWSTQTTSNIWSNKCVSSSMVTVLNNVVHNGGWGSLIQFTLVAEINSYTQGLMSHRGSSCHTGPLLPKLLSLWTRLQKRRFRLLSYKIIRTYQGNPQYTRGSITSKSTREYNAPSKHTCYASCHVSAI